VSYKDALGACVGSLGSVYAKDLRVEHGRRGRVHCAGLKAG
jgi:hypothetical protein